MVKRKVKKSTGKRRSTSKRSTTSRKKKTVTKKSKVRSKTTKKSKVSKVNNKTTKELSDKEIKKIVDRTVDTRKVISIKVGPNNVHEILDKIVPEH